MDAGQAIDGEVSGSRTLTPHLSFSFW